MTTISDTPRRDRLFCSYPWGCLIRVCLVVSVAASGRRGLRRMVASVSFLLLVLVALHPVGTADQSTAGRLSFGAIVRWFEDLTASAPYVPQQQNGHGARAGSTKADSGSGHAPGVGVGQEPAAATSRSGEGARRLVGVDSPRLRREDEHVDGGQVDRADVVVGERGRDADGAALCGDGQLPERVRGLRADRRVAGARGRRRMAAEGELVRSGSLPGSPTAPRPGAHAASGMRGVTASAATSRRGCHR